MPEQKDRSGASCRAQAAEVLETVVHRGQTLTDALAAMTPQSSDRAFLQDLCYGGCRYYFDLNARVTPLLQKPFKAKDRVLGTLLIVGAYQLIYTRVPDHAAISATVQAVRLLGRPWAAGLVNGILRRLQRAQVAGGQSAEGDEAVAYAHPQWLLERLKRDYPGHWQAIAQGNNQQAPMWLRVNRRQHSREQYLELLDTADIEASAGTLGDVSVRLHKPRPVSEIPGFGEGLLSVQDEAAQLAAELLQPAPGQRVLDACAAPGGKTCHLLERYPELGELLALELEATRIARAEENFRRLGVAPKMICADAAALQTWWDGQPFDRILLDAPCSATGVIRRHPDIKLLRRESDIAKLCDLQLALLTALWTTLAPGGLLLYATCSVLADENEGNVARFLAANANAEELPIAAPWGLAKRHGRQLLPTPEGSDGFYYACLRKSGTDL